MTDFDIIRADHRLLYEYIRGSHLYNLNTPESDVDTGGVFICSKEELLGCFGYRGQVSDERHDNTWYEIGELLRLLIKSNPTVLESIFVPKDKIIGEVNPLMQIVIDNREKFISKQCFNPFYGYAKSQIEKARGLNKKIVNPINKRLTPYDFIYTFHGQDSIKIDTWLQKRNLRSDFCGLVNVPNMHDVYGVYYDFGSHVAEVEGWRGDAAFLNFAAEYFGDADIKETAARLSSMSREFYRGIVKDDGEVRLSSIENKHVKPMCFISYNEQGFSTHCKQYTEYQQWVKNRNPVRYASNLDKNYDSKNIMHCFRLIHTAREIAEGKGIILERTWDRQFLMDVRNHKYEYDEIIAMLEEDKALMNSAIEQSTIREKVDENFVNELMIEIRKRQLYP